MLSEVDDDDEDDSEVDFGAVVRESEQQHMAPQTPARAVRFTVISAISASSMQ